MKRIHASTLAVGLLLALQTVGPTGLALGIPPCWLLAAFYRTHKERQEEQQRRIDQVEELKRLVNEFSSFARMPASRPSANDIHQVIKEAVSLYKEAQRDLKIVCNDSNEIPRLNIDREQMKRVMINLLDNAIEATDGQGEVVIDLAYDQESRQARIEVADNGRGIPPDHKMRLFEPYFSTKKSGTGLGLAIVNTIISEHQGSIRVQDNQPHGTRFIIELPVKS